MNKGIIDRKEINIKLETSIKEDELAEDIEYKKLDVEIPLWVYIRLRNKGMLEPDFLVILGKSFCDAKTLKEIIFVKDKQESEKLAWVYDNIETVVIDGESTND